MQPNIFTMESSFAGVDFGDQKGYHLNTSMLETLGKDLCRVLLIHQSIFVPPEVQIHFKIPKQFSEDSQQIVIPELVQNKSLIKLGEGDSSEGSDSAPSEDNLTQAELQKNLPAPVKSLKTSQKHPNAKPSTKSITSPTKFIRKVPQLIRSPSPKNPIVPSEPKKL